MVFVRSPGPQCTSNNPRLFANLKKFLVELSLLFTLVLLRGLATLNSYIQDFLSFVLCNLVLK